MAKTELNHTLSLRARQTTRPELIEIEWCEAENEIIFDDAKGDELIPAQVRADQQLEMDWVMRQKVFVKML